jgi:hypothetical protein
MDRYLNTLYEIVTRGLNTNSYKFALWRALATLAPETDETRPVITKSGLAPLFLEYYWPLEMKYHVRQGIDPDKDPIVMTLIRKMAVAGKIRQGESLYAFKRRTPEEFGMLIGRVTKDAFDYVIPCFHTVRGSPVIPAIYSFTGREGNAGDTIELTKGGRQFLIDNGKLVDYIATSGWVRFSESYTSAPRLHDKIGGAKLKRGSVSNWRNSLMTLQSGECYYSTGHDMTSPEVDHVLPWSFVLENKTWNLVLACRNCNNEKRDRLVNSNAVERLIERNTALASGSLSVDAKFLRDFTEWRSRSLPTHIKALYDQAESDGFPKWKSNNHSQAENS